MDELTQIFNILKKSKRLEVNDESLIKVSLDNQSIYVEKQDFLNCLDLFYLDSRKVIKESLNNEISLKDLEEKFKKNKKGLPPPNNQRFIQKNKPEQKVDKINQDLLGDLVKITSQENHENIEGIQRKIKEKTKVPIFITIIIIIISSYFLVKPESKSVLPNKLGPKLETQAKTQQKPIKKQTIVKKSNQSPTKPKKSRSQRSRFRVQARKLPKPTPKKKRLPSSDISTSKSKNKNNIEANRSEPIMDLNQENLDNKYGIDSINNHDELNTEYNEQRDNEYQEDIQDQENKEEDPYQSDIEDEIPKYTDKYEKDYQNEEDYYQEEKPLQEEIPQIDPY
jgi:hypothetical protein